MFKKTVLSLIVASLIGGCNSFDENTKKVSNDMKDRIDSMKTKPDPTPARKFAEVAFDKKRDVTVNVVNAPFMQIIEQSASKLGWTVKVMEGVDPNKRISLSTKNTDISTLIKDVAFAAGYVSIIRDGVITITPTATYTFRVPSSLLVDEKTEVEVGGNPAKLASSGGGSTGGSGAQAKPQGIDSQFKIAKKYDGVKKEFIQAINNIAGENSQVQIVGDIGLITMRGNAQSLNRVHEYINGLARHSMTVINMEVAIVEVALTGELQYGINWNNIKLDSVFGTKDATMNIGGGSLFTNAGNGLNAGYTEYSPSIANADGTTTPTGLPGASGIINALEKRTNVNVVFTQNTSTGNAKSSILFDGKQVPYLGSVSPASSGLTSSSGAAQLSFAADGLMLSVRPEVMNDGKTIMFTIVPVQTTVNGITTFDAGNGIKLQGPNQSVKQSYIEGYAQDGETVIMAGSKTSSAQGQNAGLPGLIDVPFLSTLTGGKSKNNIDREVVILLTPRIQRAPANLDTLVNASI